jgi:hypothetical protein
LETDSESEKFREKTDTRKEMGGSSQISATRTLVPEEPEIVRCLVNQGGVSSACQPTVVPQNPGRSHHPQLFEYRSRINICEVIREHVLSRFAWLYPLKPHNLPAGLGGHVHKIFETFEERVKTKRPKDHYEPESERDRL